MSVSGAMAVLLTAMLFAFAIPLVLTWSKGRKIDPFEASIIFTANYFLGFWLKPILALSSPEKYAAPWFAVVPEAHDGAIITLGLFIALVGILVFYVGYYALPWGQRAARFLPRPNWPWNPRRVGVMLALCPLGSALGLLYFLQRGHFSLGYLATNRGDVVLNAGFYAWVFSTSTVLSFVIFFVYLWQLRIPWWTRAVASIGAVFAALAALTIFAARGNLLLIIGSGLMVRHYCVKRFGFLSVAGVAVGLILFSAAFLALRGWVFAGLPSPFQHASDVIVADFVSLTTGWEGFLLVLSHYPFVYPFYHGALAGGDILWLIPRALWPGKPEEYGAFLIQQDVLPGLWSSTTRVGTFESFSPLGVGYADFGIIGALLAMLLHGVFWRMIYAYVGRERRDVSPPTAATYGLVVLSLSTYARGFVGSFLALLVIWIPVVLLVRWLGGPSRKRLVGVRTPTAYPMPGSSAG